MSNIFKKLISALSETFKSTQSSKDQTVHAFIEAEPLSENELVVDSDQYMLMVKDNYNYLTPEGKELFNKTVVEITKYRDADLHPVLVLDTIKQEISYVTTREHLEGQFKQ